MDKNKELSQSSEYIAFGEGGGMNEIRRYFTNSLESGLSENMRVGVEVVLYESHLAVIEERETDTKAWRDTAEILAKDIHKYEQQIAALTTQLARIIHCESCGSSWYDDGLTGSCPICRIAALTATIKAQAEYNTLELARIAQLQEKVEALQAEANRNIEELCRARAEKKDEYCQGCALPGRVKELEAAQGKILKVCEPCGQEGIAEMEKLEQRIKELEALLK
jgi:uncharacterized Zn finger protein (UPF0148 family)